MNGQRTKCTIAFAPQEYPPCLDEPVRGICDALNALPGITTFGSCSGHEDGSWGKCCGPGGEPDVYFKSSDPAGFSFLVRASDHRYFEGDVSIHPLIADEPPTEVHYRLRVASGGVATFDRLVQNILDHVMLPNFAKFYPLYMFDLVEKSSGSSVLGLPARFARLPREAKARVVEDSGLKLYDGSILEAPAMDRDPPRDSGMLSGCLRVQKAILESKLPLLCQLIGEAETR